MSKRRAAKTYTRPLRVGDTRGEKLKLDSIKKILAKI
jgi:hypothetical protein